MQGLCMRVTAESTGGQLLCCKHILLACTTVTEIFLLHKYDTGKLDHLHAKFTGVGRTAFHLNLS